MDDINKYLSKIDNPERFKRFVLRAHKEPMTFWEERLQNKLAKQYNSYKREIRSISDKYVEWGFLTVRTEKIDEKSYRVYYDLTSKGLKALKWRKIECFNPGWLSENRKWIITTIIAILALSISVIALIRTF